MKAEQNHIIEQNKKLVDFLIHLCEQAYGPKIELAKQHVMEHTIIGSAHGKKGQPLNKKYICDACQHEFKSKESLLDVTCPECGSTNIRKPGRNKPA